MLAENFIFCVIRKCTLCLRVVCAVVGGLLKLLKSLKSDGGTTMTSHDTMTSESQMQQELEQLQAENDILNKRLTLGGTSDELMDESKAKVMLVRANRDVVSGYLMKMNCICSIKMNCTCSMKMNCTCSMKINCTHSMKLNYICSMKIL